MRENVALEVARTVIARVVVVRAVVVGEEVVKAVVISAVVTRTVIAVVVTEEVITAARRLDARVGTTAAVVVLVTTIGAGSIGGIDAAAGKFSYFVIL